MNHVYNVLQHWLLFAYNSHFSTCDTKFKKFSTWLETKIVIFQLFSKKGEVKFFLDILEWKSFLYYASLYAPRYYFVTGNAITMALHLWPLSSRSSPMQFFHRVWAQTEDTNCIWQIDIFVCNSLFLQKLLKGTSPLGILFCRCYIVTTSYYYVKFLVPASTKYLMAS